MLGVRTFETIRNLEGWIEPEEMFCSDLRMLAKINIYIDRLR